jgi:hypothetical protein
VASFDEDRVRRIEDLVRRTGEIPDTESRQTATSLMEAVLELHGAGMDRLLEIVFDSGDAGKAMIRKMAADPLVSSILILHGLHPDDLDTRVQHALGKMHGNAELITTFEGVVRIRLTGEGCGLRAAVEAAVRDAAPDAVDIVIEEESGRMDSFVPLSALLAAIPEIT